LQARRDHPEATQKQLAKRVQVSDRTIRAVLASAPERKLAMTAT
jgi:DNA-binding XRE family transcriptional regulator